MIPDGPPSPDREAPPDTGRWWALGLLAAAVLLAWVGGAVENFRPEWKPPPDDSITLPIPLEPVGELERPPTLFRWSPGDTGSVLSQVVVHRAGLERIWSSAPLQATQIEIDPLEIFQGIPAGEACSWRVREIESGLPRASSAIVEFEFLEDVEGRGKGEGPGQGRLVVD